ncbi:MAG: ROK family protein, partial [Cetobacterium sp.]
SFRFNSEFSLALFIYIHEENGIDTAFINVSNLYGEVIEKIKVQIKEFKLESFDLLIEKMILKYSTIKVIAFGIPGVELNGKLIVDYDGLNNQPLTNHIRKKFSLPVIFENDINAVVYGYSYLKEVRDDECIVGIYFPDKYPPGAGVYFNGKIYRGRNGLVGEINNLPLGIDWDKFDFNKGDMNDIIIKIILSFNCMYNPNTIVLYGRDIEESIREKIIERCNSEIQRAMIPEIIISKEINSDFEVGIKQIALKYLEPKLMTKIK